MDTRRKLIIPANPAKYDASRASSGTSRRDSSDGRGLGSTEGGGLCRSCAPDGRCISLPKVLLTDRCTDDCKCCVDRTPKKRLPRMPGRGVRLVERLLMTRRVRSVRCADLGRLRVPVAKVLPFVALPDPLPRDGHASPLRPQVRRTGEPARAIARERQADLFA
jgi:predicted DNA-binding helix-hairpin-helix protein